MVQWTKNMRPCWNFVHYAIWKPLPTSQSCCIKNLYNMFTQKSCILSFSPKDNNGILTNSVTWVASYLNGKKKKKSNNRNWVRWNLTHHKYIHTYISMYICVYIHATKAHQRHKLRIIIFRNFPSMSRFQCNITLSTTSPIFARRIYKKYIYIY